MQRTTTRFSDSLAEPWSLCVVSSPSVKDLDWYRDVLQMSLVDKSLTPDEDALLASVRQKLKISNEDHKKILQDCGWTHEEFSRVQKEDPWRKECCLCLDAPATHIILDWSVDSNGTTPNLMDSSHSGRRQVAGSAWLLPFRVCRSLCAHDRALFVCCSAFTCASARSAASRSLSRTSVRGRRSSAPSAAQSSASSTRRTERHQHGIDSRAHSQRRAHASAATATAAHSSSSSSAGRIQSCLFYASSSPRIHAFLD